MVNGHAVCQCYAVILFRLVRHDNGFDCAFGPHRLGNLPNRMPFRPLANLLAACHGHGVVVQNLVGDVHACSNRLANRQQAAVEVGAVTEVGKHVCVRGKRLLAHPRHALTTHLGKAHGGPVHPQRHVVAANARHRPRAFGHFGRCVVRAARTKPRRAFAVNGEHRQ